jgi:hypothetical protein
MAESSNAAADGLRASVYDQNRHASVLYPNRMSFDGTIRPATRDRPLLFFMIER